MDTKQKADDETIDQNKEEVVSEVEIKEEQNPSVDENKETDSSKSEEPSSSSEEDNSSSEEESSDEVIVKIDGETPPQEEDEKRAPEWVRNVRKTNREQQKRIRELEEKLKALAPVEETPKLGQKPTLEACDYDADKFETELERWHLRKQQVEAAAQKAKAEEAKQQEAWNAKLENFQKAKSSLKVKDFEEAEETIQEILNQTQLAIIVEGAKNPAELVYALGKNPKKAKELSEINNPVKFAFEIAKLETRVSVERKKSAPPPEKTVKGAAPLSGSFDSTLERLRAEADKTGDRSKVAKYLKSQRNN
jgi:hypothetical protein